MFDKNRRDFITLLGGAAAWPLGVRAAIGDADRPLFLERGPAQGQASNSRTTVSIPCPSLEEQLDEFTSHSMVA